MEFLRSNHDSASVRGIRLGDIVVIMPDGHEWSIAEQPNVLKVRIAWDGDLASRWAESDFEWWVVPEEDELRPLPTVVRAIRKDETPLVDFNATDELQIKIRTQHSADMDFQGFVAPDDPDRPLSFKMREVRHTNRRFCIVDGRVIDKVTDQVVIVLP